MVTVRRTLGLLLAWALLLPPAARTQVREAPEHEIRAAFLYNFVKFVEWPEGSLPQEGLTLCVLGDDDDFAVRLRRVLTGKIVHGKPVSVLEVSTPKETDCQILFIDDSREGDLPAILEAVANRGTLTIGESEELAEGGVMIAFTRESTKVRFIVNVTAAEREGLKVSSQLLKLAAGVLPAGREQ